MSQNFHTEAAYRTSVIIWAALLFSQFLFLVILFFTKRELFNFDFSRPVFGEIAPVILVFAFIATLNFALSFYLKSFNVKKAIDEQKPALLQTALILGVALCESISLIGMVAAFAFDYQYFFLWFALAILGTILHFPKRDKFIAASYKNM